jgi:hypothetical protein
MFYIQIVGDKLLQIHKQILTIGGIHNLLEISFYKFLQSSFLKIHKQILTIQSWAK